MFVPAFGGPVGRLESFQHFLPLSLACFCVWLMLAQAAVAVSVPVDGALSDGDAAHPPVRIGMPLESPPYIYENPSDGLDVQVIRGVFDWADIKVVFVHAPLVRLPLLLDNGLVDGFISFSHVSTLADGGRHYHQTRPYSYWRNAIIARSGEMNISVSDWTDRIDTLRIGTFPGADQVLNGEGGVDRRMLSQAMVIDNSQRAARLLARGRIDIYVGDYWSLGHFYQSMKAATGHPLRVLYRYEPTPHWLIFDREELARTFDTALSAFECSGAQEALFDQYRPRTSLAQD